MTVSARGALLAGALAVLTLPVPGRAGEAYYLLLFSSQRIPNESNHAHTFATFVRASWDGDGPRPGAPALEVCTISWLPVSGPIRSRALLPERGRNCSMEETLVRVLGDGQHVSMWGPYEIEPELYERATRQAALLESGRVRYRANDGGRRSERVCNCIHAVGAVANGNGLHWISPWWGEPAGWVVLLNMRPWVIDPCRTHPWVGSALGLDAYPLRWREGYAITTFAALLEQFHTLLSGGRWPESTYGPPAP